VLETLAKKGVPTRAEISDAAMAERAEGVMLNKGPFILEAVKALGSVLTRMAAHHHKKTATLRALHAWDHITT
jgi:pyruvate kinase